MIENHITNGLFFFYYVKKLKYIFEYFFSFLIDLFYFLGQNYYL